MKTFPLPFSSFIKQLVGALLTAIALVLPATGQTIYGVEYSAGSPYTAPWLLAFAANNPGTVSMRVAITGLASGQVPVGIDFRPSTGQLYALGYDASLQTGQLYTLNLTTAVATPVGSASVSLPLGTYITTPNPVAESLPHIGFDFDPATDQVRVCGGTTQANLLLSPATGIVAVTAANLFYAPGDAYAGTTPGIGTIAYTSAAASASTTLYAIDETANRLAALSDPATGGLRTVAPLGISSAPSLNWQRNVDLDFYYDPTTGTETGYFSTSAMDPASGYANLRTLNLATGSLSAVVTIGPMGGYYEVRDIAVQPAARPLAAKSAELAGQLALAPNPLTSNTTLAFDLPRAARVELLVTDALGRVVDVQNAGLRPAGAQAIAWQRRQQNAGIYFFTLRINGQPAGTKRGVLTD